MILALRTTLIPCMWMKLAQWNKLVSVKSIMFNFQSVLTPDQYLYFLSLVMWFFCSQHSFCSPNFSRTSPSFSSLLWDELTSKYWRLLMSIFSSESSQDGRGELEEVSWGTGRGTYGIISKIKIKKYKTYLPTFSSFHSITYDG